MKHKLLLLYSWFVRVLLFFAPDIPFIMRFRGFLYGLGMKRCGKDFQVSHDVIFNGLEGISVGNNVFINNYNIILGTYGVTIENEVIVGPSCVFSANNHLPKGRSFRYGGRDKRSIYIGEGSWIAANCAVVAGSYIPPFALLSAGCVYTASKEKEMPSGYIYVGSPAKPLKEIGDSQDE